MAGKVVDTKNNQKKILGLTQDISKLKLLEENYRSKNQLLNVAQARAQIGHWQWDSRTNLATCSENMYRMLNLKSGSKLSLQTLLKDVHPDDIDSVYKNMKLSLKTKKYPNFVHRIVLNGEVRHIKVMGEVNTDKKGNVTTVTGISQDITQQHHYQNKILRKNYLLSLSEKKANLGHWYWYTGTDYVTGSRNLYKLFDLDAKEEEMIKIKTLHNYVHPDDIAHVKKYTSESIKKKSLNQFEFRIIVSNGAIRTLKFSGQIFTDDQDEIEEILGIFQDITEQKVFESELLKKNNLLNLAEKNAQMGHWHLKPGDTFATWSNNLLSMYGMTPEDAKIDFSEMMEYVHPEDRKILNEHIKSFQEKGGHGDFTHRIVLKDGTIKTIRIHDTVYKNEKGDVEEIVGVCQDITEQTKRENKIRNILDSAPYPNFILSSNFSIEIVNRAAIQLFEYSSSDLIGKTIEELVPSRFYTKVLALQKNFELNSDDSKLALEEELFMVSKSGKEIPVEITLGPVYTEDGLLCAWIARDITSEKIAEANILEANQQLQELTKELKFQNHQLEDFSHITTHNLRSPVNNLNTLLSLFKISEKEKDKEILFEKFEKVIDHLTLTLDTLVDNLKVKTAEQVELEPISLEKVLHKTLDILTAEIEQTGAKIDFDFQVAEVMYNKLYLDSIFQNMVSNALKYSSPKRRPVITVISDVVDDKIRLTFKDNGLGMDLEMYGHHLFKMNKVFHNHPKAKGVGLFMTKTQVESMGGEIHVESEVDKGTTFHICLSKHGNYMIY